MAILAHRKLYNTYNESFQYHINTISKLGRPKYFYLKILGELDDKGLGGGVDGEEGSGLQGSEGAQVDNCALPPDLSSGNVQKINTCTLPSSLSWYVCRTR